MLHRESAGRVSAFARLAADPPTTPPSQIQQKWKGVEWGAHCRSLVHLSQQSPTDPPGYSVPAPSPSPGVTVAAQFGRASGVAAEPGSKEKAPAATTTAMNAEAVVNTILAVAGCESKNDSSSSIDFFKPSTCRPQ